MKTDITIQCEINNGTSTQVVLNLPKILSSYNRRGMNNVDERGNAQLYTVSASLIATNANGYILAAPNTYVTKRAVKDWHDAWVRRLRKAGIKRSDLGPYMKFLRPYLHRAHYVSESGDTISGVTAIKELDTEVFDNGAQTPVDEGLMTPWAGEEWSYTEIVNTAAVESFKTSNTFQGDEMVDEYFLTLCDQDAEKEDDDTRTLKTAGMIYSWLGSFTQRPTPTEAETLVDPTNTQDNSLMALRDSDLSSGELLDMAQEAVQEKAPWDRDGSRYYLADIQGGVMAARSGSSNTIISEVPCGLMQLHIDNDQNGAEVAYVNLEVLSIEDM
jgi:hypothetical protein